MSGYWDRITSSRLTRRRALGATAALGAGAAALSMMGCGGGDSEGGSGSQQDLNKLIRSWEAPDETSKAVTGGIYRGARSADAGSMDPFTSTTTTTGEAIGGVYETLLSKKSGPGLNPDADLDLEGRLAESWEVRDPLTVVFRIRQNAKFHDVAPVSGRMLDIDDVKLSFERFIARSTRAATLKQFLDKAEFPDNRTMTLKLKDPYADTELLFTGIGASPPILPKEALDGRFDPSQVAIGTGYNVLSTYQPSIKYEYKKHPGWWRTGRPFVDGYTYAVVPEYAQRLAQFLVGNILEFTPTQQDMLQTLKDAPSVKPYAVDPSGSYQFIWFGQGKNATDRYAIDQGAPWMDKRVRQALSMSINRKVLNDHFANAAPFEAQGLPISFKQDTHVMAQRASYWLDPEKNELGESSKFYKYDLAEAKKLMAAAGHPSGLDLELIFNSGPQYGAIYHERVELTADMLAKGGLFRAKQSGIVYEDYFNNYRNPPRKFSGVSFGASGSYGNLDLEIFNSFHTEGGTFKGFQDKKIDDLIDRQRREFDKQKRVALVHEFQKVAADEMYVIQNHAKFSTFTLKWPYLHNFSWPDWGVWLSEDMPRRNG